jgi:hypothetical protein
MRLALGIVSTAVLLALTYWVTAFDWVALRTSWFGLLCFGSLLAVGVFWASLVRWAWPGTTWVELAVVVLIAFVTECLLLPASVPDHSHRSRPRGPEKPLTPR